MVDAIKAAEILVTAHLRNELLEDIPDDCKAQTPDEAIEVQLAIMNHDKVTHNGWKVALTNKELQEKAGVTEPAYGPIFEEFVFDNGHIFSDGQPTVGGIECEFAVILKEDLPASGAPYTTAQAAEAVGSVHPAIEITGMRFKTRSNLGRPGSTMDFAGNFAFVFAEGTADWQRFDLPSHKVQHIVDGELIKESTGAWVLDNPLNSISFLANKLANRGIDLKAGEWISTGAATGPIPIGAGSKVEANFGELGSCSCIMPKV